MLVALAALSAACGGDDDDATATPVRSSGTDEPAEVIAIFGGPEMIRATLAAGKDASGVQMFLLGSGATGDGQFDEAAIPAVTIRGGRMTGTPRDADFPSRFGAVYPYDQEFPGLREAYDSVYLVALAALTANSADPALMRESLLFVANPPGEVVSASPDGLGRAAELASAGEDSDLTGAGGALDFSGAVGGASFASKAAVETWTVINGAASPLETRDVDLVAEMGAANPAGELKRGDGITAPVKIGAIVSIGGPEPEKGATIRNAMELAVTEINDAGGIAGQPVELVVKDTGGDSDAAEQAVVDLAAEGAVAVIGPSLDDVTLAVAAGLGDDSPVPVLTLSSAPAQRSTVSGRLFGVVPLTSMETVVLANLALESELQVACVVDDGSPNSRAMSDAFREAFEHKEGLVRTPVTVDEGDYAGAIAACTGA
jgi:ABC-type branched-subunit amino acid transport system substrate-binding protein